MLLACVAVVLSAVATPAQTADSNLRQVSAVIESSTTKLLESDPVNVSAVEERAPIKLVSSATGRVGRFEQLLSTAIEERLGSHYSWGATGPNFFDCSGFVWSTFQTAGIKFDRASARSLWATFAPATKEEETKFGTLVFFSGLAHVGIVADKNGFYHASRHHGVIYSPFNDYWLSRIDGFRRVPLTPPPAE